MFWICHWDFWPLTWTTALLFSSFSLAFAKYNCFAVWNWSLGFLNFTFSKCQIGGGKWQWCCPCWSSKFPDDQFQTSNQGIYLAIVKEEEDNFLFDNFRWGLNIQQYSDHLNIHIQGGLNWSSQFFLPH